MTKWTKSARVLAGSLAWISRFLLAVLSLTRSTWPALWCFALVLTTEIVAMALFGLIDRQTLKPYIRSTLQWFVLLQRFWLAR